MRFVPSLVAYLDMPVEVEERAGAVRLTQPRGAVEFDRVSFSYQSHATKPTAAIEDGSLDRVRREVAEAYE